MLSPCGLVTQHVTTGSLTRTWTTPSATHDAESGWTKTGAMLLGPSTSGALLESEVLGLDSDDPVIIHAMPLRPTFHRFL